LLKRAVAKARDEHVEVDASRTSATHRLSVDVGSSVVNRTF
jgi:hypothetical protein